MRSALPCPNVGPDEPQNKIRSLRGRRPPGDRGLRNERIVIRGHECTVSAVSRKSTPQRHIHRMGLSELTALVDMLRERGVFFYRQGDLELHLAPGVEPPRKEEKSEPDKPGWRGYGREERDALGIGDS